MEKGDILPFFNFFYSYLSASAGSRPASLLAGSSPEIIYIVTENANSPGISSGPEYGVDVSSANCEAPQCPDDRAISNMTPVISPRRPITPDSSRKSKIFCSFFAPKAFVTPISLVFESDFMKLMENKGIREIEITKEAPGKAEEELKEEGIKKGS